MLVRYHATLLSFITGGWVSVGATPGRPRGESEALSIAIAAGSRRRAPHRNEGTVSSSEMFVQVCLRLARDEYVI